MLFRSQWQLSRTVEKPKVEVVPRIERPPPEVGLRGIAAGKTIVKEIYVTEVVPPVDLISPIALPQEKQIIDLKPLTKQEPKVKLDYIPGSIQEAAPEIIPKIEIKQEPDLGPKTKPKPGTKSIYKVVPKVIPKIIPEIVPKIIPKIIPDVVPRITGPPTPFIASFVPSREREVGREEYTLFIRRKGIFRPSGTFEDLGKAFTVGRGIVSRTAAASFKIEPYADSFEIEAAASKYLPREQFRRSKLDKSVFVERREKRIKSPGELGEITFKGLAALRRKRRTKGFSIF